MNIGIIGTGAYGLALALQFNENRKNVVRAWTKFESEKDEIVSYRENRKVLPGVKIPSDIEISTNLEYVVKNSDIIVIAVPAAFVGDVSSEIKKYYRRNQQFVLASKGIERGTCQFVDEIFRKHIKTKNYCVISGPSFAVDIVTDCPIGLTIASERKKTIKIVRKALENETIRLRESNDIIGVEICGSIKNVIAIAAGILDGMGYPESTQAMFITESLNDIKELISKLGGNKDTILTYAGFGDLLLTATSKKSRNYTYGMMIGKKLPQEEIENYVRTTTIEGLYTIQSIYKLLKHKKVRMPIINLIYDVINEKKSVSALPKFLITKK